MGILLSYADTLSCVISHIVSRFETEWSKKNLAVCVGRPPVNNSISAGRQTASSRALQGRVLVGPVYLTYDKAGGVQYIVSVVEILYHCD